MRLDEEKLRSYLLGSASEADEEEISLQLFADEDFAYRLENAENELLEDYLDEQLSPQERTLFHQNFISARRHELLREIKMLRTAARKSSSPAQKPYEEMASAKQGWFNLFTRPLFAGAAVAVLLAVISSIVWLAYFRDVRTPLELEYALLNRQKLADPATTSSLFAVNLVSGSFRDTTGAAVYQVSKMSDDVLFRLALPQKEAEGSELSVSILGRGKSSFNVRTARVFQNQFGSELRFIAPKQALPAGNYEIKIDTDDGRYANTPFQFKVE